MKRLIVCSLFLFASAASAADWSIKGKGVELYKAGKLIELGVAPGKSGGLVNSIIIVYDTLWSGAGENPACYVFMESEKKSILFCEDRENWRLSRAVFYLEKEDTFKCIKNCSHDGPHVLRWVTEEGD